MEERGLRRDQRGVSEVYGTVLIVSFTFVTALFLIGTGWMLVGQLTTETTDSLSRDSMRNVDRVIDSVAAESVNKSGTFTFPEESAKDVSASKKDGEFNLTITTVHDDFWKRTEAHASGEPRTGSDTMFLGTIKHESEERGVTAYQGGALWRRPNPDGKTFLLSEPDLGVTDAGLDVGIVSLAGVETITEGSEVTVRQTATAGPSKQEQLQQFMSKYWTDRHNPSITAPVEINITIESQYADGWASYAEDGMGVDPSNVSYPHNGDDETVKIALGTIGDLPESSDNPTFGDEDILYSGSSDLAYMYYNDTAGEIDGNAKQFEITDPSPSSDYEVALYNESGRWVIYNTSADGWQDAAGNDVSPPDEVNGSVTSDSEYPIHTPAAFDDSAATPVCVVTGSDADVTEYIDEDGEGCLEHMVGIEEDMVGPLVAFPEFTVAVTNPGNVPEDMNVGESFNTTVEVENVGNASGQRPLGIYALNRTNWIGSGTESDPAPDFEDGILLAGNESGNVSLDPGDSSTVERDIDTAEIEDQSSPSYSVTGKNWTIFATSGGTATDVPGDPSHTNTVEFFELEDTEAQFTVTKIDPRRNSVEAGENLTIDVTVEETRGEINGGVEQPLTLSANGGLADLEPITLDSNESTVEELTWQTRSGDNGTALLEGSTFDDSNSTAVTVTEKGEANFEVTVTDTNSPVGNPITVGDDLTVDATIENTGDRQDVQKIRLNDFNGSLVDWEQITLASGETVNKTFTWTTVRGDAGEGDVSAVSNDDSDSTKVKIEEPSNVRDPVDVVFVIDETGSMGWNDPDDKRIDATELAIDELNDSMDQAAAVGYDYDPWWGNYGYSDGYKWHHRLSNDLAAVKSSLTTDPQGSTDIAIGIDQAERELTSPRANSAHKPVMIVLTDGVDNSGMDPVQRAKNVDEDIDIYTVGLDSYDKDTLETIAQEGGSGEGELKKADNPEDLKKIFENITKDITDQSPAFQMNNVNTNTPVTAGQPLEVTVDVENVGDTSGERIVSLKNFDGTVVESKIPNLAVGDTATVTLEWDTTDATPGDSSITDSVTVETQNDSVSPTVTVEPRPEADLKIASFDPDDTTRLGNTFTVSPTLKNQGDAEAKDVPVALTVTDQDTGNTVAGDEDTVTLGPGEDKQPILQWDIPSNAPLGDYDLEVDFAGEDQVDNVTVQPALTNLNVSIANTNDPVIAGEKLDVVVEVENTGSEDKEPNVVLKDAGTDSTLDIAFDVAVQAGNSEVVELTWATQRSDGAGSKPVRVEIANTNEKDDTDVSINDGPDSLDAVAMGQRGNPLNIDLSEVEISS